MTEALPDDEQVAAHKRRGHMSAMHFEACPICNPPKPPLSDEQQFCEYCGKSFEEAVDCRYRGEIMFCRPTPDDPIPGVVKGSELEKQIKLARAEIAKWPKELRIAMGLSRE